MRDTGPASPNRPRDVRADVRAYRDHFADDDRGADRRKDAYSDVVVGYYDLATEFYERGWGRSFHFAPLRRGEPLPAAIARYEREVAAALAVGADDLVLDVGCGVGGPMREVARATGARVVGVNSNAHQVERARRYNAEEGLASRCEVVEADFMALPRGDASVDAAYAFEALCHAPDLEGVFREIHRVLRPGGRLVVSDWALTDAFEAADPVHRRLAADIELGNGVPALAPIGAWRSAAGAAGFELEHVEDAADRCDPGTPWYRPISGDTWDLLGLRRTRVGRQAVRALLRVLEASGVAPKGSHQVSELLNTGADALVAAGRARVFTPMLFAVARKR